MGLVARREQVGWLREHFGQCQRRSRGLMQMAESTYRYESRRNDEPLRTKLVGRARKAVEKTLRGKRGKVKRPIFPLFPLRMEIPHKARDFHYPTASATADHPPFMSSKKRRPSYDQLHGKWGQVNPLRNAILPWPNADIIRDGVR